MFGGKSRLLFISIVVCFACSKSLFAQKSPSSEADLKRQAETRFNNNDYTGATLLYSQLLSLYPKDPEFNYRYGVCLLQSSKDKAAAVTYLETASRYPKSDIEVFYYLGKAFMYTNNYGESLIAFENFKKRAGSGKVKKLEVDLLINNCKSAKELMKNRKNVVILNQQQVIRNSFYSAYVFDSASGKMLSTPERFLTSEDKSKTPNPTMYLTPDGQTIYYASYGKKADKGKDIFRITKQTNGDWGQPENLGNVINSNEDEDYPYLLHDGRTLYFASRGHNSIGGYDIFKSVFDFNTGKWSEPENAGIPINTPDDDIFYVPTLTGDYAQYASAIESDNDKIGVRKIKLGDVLNQLAVINGQYFSEDQPQRRDAKISVIRIKDNGLVTTVRTDPRSGKYSIDVPPGDDYTLVVEAGGYLAHAENFSLPEGLFLADLRQKVNLNKSSDVERMTLSNYFTVDKKSSGDSLAIVSAAPTNVISNEYRLKDGDQSKLQPIDIKGRTVYVTPPKNLIDSKSTSDTHALFEQHVATDAGKNDQQDATATLVDSKNETLKKSSHEINKAETQSKNKHDDKTIALKEDSSKESSFDTNKTETQSSDKTDDKAVVMTGESSKENTTAPTDKKESGSAKETAAKKSKEEKSESKKKSDEIVSKTSEIKFHDNQLLADSHVKEAESQPEVESKTNVAEERIIPENVSNKELVKIAYEDAKVQKAEAETIHKEAEMSKQLATEQDSLSKSQIKDAQLLLKEGGKDGREKAKLMLKESEDNSKQAKARLDKANELEAEATQKNNEADRSIAEAELLMKMNKTDGKGNVSTKGKLNGTVQPATASVDSKESNVVNHTDADLSESSDDKTSAASSSEKQKEVTGQPVGSSLKKSVNNEQEKTIAVKSTLTADKNVASNTANSPKQNASIKEDQQLKSGAASYSSSVSDLHDSKNANEEKALAVNTEKSNTSHSSGTGTMPVVPVNAKQPYIEHHQMMDESKTIAVQADELQQKADEMPASKKRDSLITRANDMNMLSIKKWQAAQAKLNEAKRNDPEVETKMKEIEKINQSSALNESDETITSKQSERGESKKMSSGNDAVASNATAKKAGSTEAAGKTGEIPEASETKSADIPLNTSSPEYPEFIATNEEIKTRQTETISIFAEAMKLNKLSQQRKEEEISIRQNVLSLTDQKEKYMQLRKADVAKQQSDSLQELAQKKFRTAQITTGEVALLTNKASKLREKINASTLSKQNASAASIPPAPVESKKTDATSLVDQNTNNGLAKATMPADKNVQAKTKNHSSIKSINVAPKKVDAVNSIASSETPSAVQPGVDKTTISTSEPATTDTQMNTEPVEKTNASEASSSAKPVAVASTKYSDSEVSTSEVPKTTSGKAVKEKPVKAAIANPAEQKTLPLEPTFASVESRSKTSESAVTSDKPVVKKILADASPATDHEERTVLFDSAPVTKESVFSIASKLSYNSSNPIPMNPSLPDGLVFKVQVGAFHSPLPENAFKNLQPVSGETTRPGWIRYCVGMFKAFEAANILKSEMKTTGYKDAFVVAYYNGKRISLSDAYALIRRAGTDDKKLYASNIDKETMLLHALKITAPKTVDPKDEDVNSFYGVPTESSNDRSDAIEYAVQVGVYKTTKVPASLVTLMPLQNEPTKTGYYRFTTGRYALYASADSSKRIAVRSGVKDAFIVAYRNGNHVSLNAVRSIIKKEDVQNENVKATEESVATDHPSALVSSTSLQVIYKVQLGAFRHKLTDESMNKFKTMSSFEISQETTASGMNIIYAGSFTDLNLAAAAMTELATKGSKDAFVAAFSRGKKMQIISQNSLMKK